MSLTPEIRLGINIDHIATIRNARGGVHPDPVDGARLAIKSGADGITAHLREDRRHIRDADIERLEMLCQETDVPLNFEMAATDEMRDIALRLKPHAVCIVPERREERTTEGGLNVAGGHNHIAPIVRDLTDAGCRVSLFIEAVEAQIRASADIGAAVVELHTGAYAHAIDNGDVQLADEIVDAMIKGAALAATLGLEVHAGHGLTYSNVGRIAAIPQIVELNIGHFLIGEAVFVGLPKAMAQMRAAIEAARP
ncbi:pyridoxine 5'-phosphate synthase [Robiginitomaculum antarcticum]|uniref:pyridoxine 5'-phosphate synthase n=1 Tax=Robiginitomaculum antarcticum TaxID=437507 RepID=UPI00036DCFED|nr:pyridoxine 5'-phosphate synthase [Robiginitomaculum antarcticum]